MEHFREILRPEIQKYIQDNLHENLGRLLLKKSPFPEVSMQEIAQQIKGKQIAVKKFPFLLKENIVFPPHLNLEQASSESTAKEKAENLSGRAFLDLTCGFGIDAYFLSQNFSEVTLLEQNKDLLEIVQHNWKTLGREASFINENLEQFLEINEKKKHFDLIYLDPARRDKDHRKKFLLSDLSPNILEIQDKLLSISKKIMIKLSPLIDLKYLQTAVKSIDEIEIIAVKNEVKEIILHLVPNTENKLKITTKNLNTEEPNFSFSPEEESAVTPEFSDISEYLYIPNNAVLKSGAFNLISKKFGLKKLHPNTHLYTSDKATDFCGRVFKVKEINAKEIKKGNAFNIISKNHPLTPEQIKTKYKLKNGGEHYLIFTQSKKGMVILQTL
ncbi:MAG: RsmD family RNA methyltransferase [Flavobacteriaceae bacterium]